MKEIWHTLCLTKCIISTFPLHIYSKGGFYRQLVESLIGSHNSSTAKTTVAHPVQQLNSLDHSCICLQYSVMIGWQPYKRSLCKAMHRKNGEIFIWWSRRHRQLFEKFLGSRKHLKLDHSRIAALSQKKNEFNKIKCIHFADYALFAADLME